MTEQIATVGFKPYEIEILEKWSKSGTDTDPARGGVPPKATWIKERLLEVGEDYPYRMWREYRDFCERASRLGIVISHGTYGAFRTYVYILRKKLGLVKSSRTEKAGPFERHYVTLVESKLEDPGWQRPFQEAYESTDWRKKSRKEKRRIRRKPVETHKRRGRPREHRYGVK